MALINTIFHSFQLELRSTRREQTTSILISTIMKTKIEKKKSFSSTAVVMLSVKVYVVSS